MPATLALMLCAAAPSSLHADEQAVDIRTLEEAVRAGSNQPTRFVLSSGKTVIGKVVKIGDDALIIRRPSAGLLTLSLAEIVSVNIKAEGGELMHGRIMRLADGAIGWLADDKVKPMPTIERADAASDALSESGGPLIPIEKTDLQAVDRSGSSIEGANAKTETIAVKPAEVVTPERVSPVDAGPVRLLVAADETSESDKLIYFRLSLSEPAPQAVLIIYTMINGTAVAPGDYTHRQGVVVFEPGQTQAVVATSIVNDDVAEGAESFSFFVTGDPAAVSIEERKVAAIIEDDDG
ncbi:MAG: Calx-beta domain-containing protein [Geminicoccaceae bacterium]